MAIVKAIPLCKHSISKHCFLFIDKSIAGRWLLSKGRQEEAKEVLEFTVKRNGIGYPMEMIRTLANDESTDANAKQANILDLLRDVSMARLSLIIWFGW